jgi:hypothetical protein
MRRRSRAIGRACGTKHARIAHRRRQRDRAEHRVDAQIQNFNVYTTDLGEDGIDLGKLYDYDIILLDLNLPDIVGLRGFADPQGGESQDADPDPLRPRQYRGQGQRSGLRSRRLPDKAVP